MNKPSTTPAADDLCVARVPIFSALSLEQQQAVARFARPVRVRAGEAAFSREATRTKLFVLHTGQVQIVRQLPDGREQLLRVILPGEFAGEEAFLGGSIVDYAVIAAVDSQMCVFEHSDLPALIATYPAIALSMLRMVSSRLLQTERRVAMLAVSDMTTRLADYLLELPLVFGDNGQRQVMLPMTKRDVASYLGMTPETLSRTFTRLNRAGAISTDTGLTVRILDLDRLVELGAGA